MNDQLIFDCAQRSFQCSCIGFEPSDGAIEAVEPSGGKILQPKESIGPFGFRAVVLDTEGNRIALHSK